MKKLLVLLLALLLVSGCSKVNNTTVTGGEEVLFSSSKTTYTKADLYNDMLGNDITDLLSNNLVKELAVLEGADLDTYVAEAQDYINDLKEQGYEYFISYYYGSEEAYIDSYVSFEASDMLLKNDVMANFDKHVEEYAPIQAEIVYFDEAAQANAAIDAVNAGKTFAFAASENGYSKEVYTSVYTSKKTLPEEVRNYINENESGLSGVIETATVVTDSEGNSTSTPRFYLVNLISKNVEDFKDDFVKTVIEDVDATTVINNLVKKHNVQIHDQRIYDLLSVKYEAVK
ncbi:MAG: hypothetical protein Q4B60_02810 [Erysipelotrichaceae bacterium]|nr:hypothetical protein [Erysipelotrichaceae bacterium]